MLFLALESCIGYHPRTNSYSMPIYVLEDHVIKDFLISCENPEIISQYWPIDSEQIRDKISLQIISNGKSEIHEQIKSHYKEESIFFIYSLIETYFNRFIEEVTKIRSEVIVSLEEFIENSNKLVVDKNILSENIKRAIYQLISDIIIKKYNTITNLTEEDRSIIESITNYSIY